LGIKKFVRADDSKDRLKEKYGKITREIIDASKTISIRMGAKIKLK
jgi:hypothetical protein